MRRNELTESFRLPEILIAGLAVTAKTYFRDLFPPHTPTSVCNYLILAAGWV